MKSKICKGCNLDLLICNFNKHSATKDGLRSKCIECRRLEHIEYRKANPEKIKQLQKLCDQRKVSTPELIEKKRLRAKRYNSSEAGRLKNHLRAEQNKHKYKYSRKKVQLTDEQKLAKSNRIKNWRLRNKDKANAAYSLRRAKKRNATPPWLTKEDKQNISDLYTICQLFKIYTGQEYHVDHIVPLVNKNVCGLHIPCNLRVVSAFENYSKNNKFDESLAIDYSAEAYHASYATL